MLYEILFYADCMTRSVQGASKKNPEYYTIEIQNTKCNARKKSPKQSKYFRELDIENKSAWEYKENN